MGHVQRIFFREQLLKYFNHACPIFAGRHQVNSFFQTWNRIGNGHRESAKTQERIVIFRIADSHNAGTGQAQFSQGGPESRALIHSSRKDHHRLPVENDLQIQSEFTNRLVNRRLVRSHGCNNRNGPPREDSRQTVEAFPQKQLADVLPRSFSSPVDGSIKQGSVLRHDQVKETQFREHTPETLEFAAGDQHKLAAGLPHPLQHLPTCLCRRCRYSPEFRHSPSQPLEIASYILRD